MTHSLTATGRGSMLGLRFAALSLTDLIGFLFKLEFLLRVGTIQQKTG